MLSSRDYLREVRKFTTSQYWNTGVRITAGVMLPTLVLEYFGMLVAGMPFLWGALFVSITDAPGPIHHRRNGLLAAVAFNSFTVLITTSLHDYPTFLVAEIILLSFFYSMFGIFGNRAGAIGVLATLIMLLSLVPHGAYKDPVSDTLLIMSGGLWYTAFSLVLYRIRPYRLAEQAVGENLIAIAGYFRARGSLYKEGEDVDEGFIGVMEKQSTVLKCQEQAGEILFKTRQFVADTSPKGRSVMMIFIDSNDLLEQVMSSYQDYEDLHRTIGHTGLLNKFHDVIYKLSDELERIGLIIQSGAEVRDDVSLAISFHELEEALRRERENTNDINEISSLNAMTKTLSSLRRIANLVQRLVLYTRLEIKIPTSYTSMVEANRLVVGQPISGEIILENLTLKSNTFRHAVRLTLAMLIGYAISIFFSLSHGYWVLLTILTILRPVYAVSRQRNIQRLGGTLLGAALAAAALYFISDRSFLLAIMVVSMVMSYSLLRVNYFGFVLFLTVYIIITFHFLNPSEFTSLIKLRLLDTVIGSLIAGVAARFILPVWGREEIENSLNEMLRSQRNYFDAAWQALMDQTIQIKGYKLARKDVVVALTNLSDNFQRVLNEPKQVRQAEQLHKFVIASHILTGHIAALSKEKISPGLADSDETIALVRGIRREFDLAEDILTNEAGDLPEPEEISPESNRSPGQLSVIYTLIREIRLISSRINNPVNKQSKASGTRGD